MGKSASDVARRGGGRKGPTAAGSVTKTSQTPPARTARASALDSTIALTIRLPLLLPLASAAVYAMAAILIKVAISRGANSWAVALWSNLSMGLLALPLLLFGHDAWRPASAPWALLAGCLFFAGQIGTFRSLASGDVSIATPALASKLVFVALMSLGLPGNRPDPDLWLAVGLTMAGVFLLHRGPCHHSARPLATAGWALFAAVSFAGTDIITQTAVPRTGFTLFMPVMFGTLSALSVFLLLPHALRAAGRRAQSGAWGWGAAGIALLAMQSAGVATSIGIFGDATGVNVVYSSRGLWSLLLLALVARRLGVPEGAMDRKTFALRFLGSILILTGVVITLL